jgi:hypothetical protein
MRKGLTFTPPRATPTPELRWVLLRAFGPADRPATEHVDTEQALRLARRLDAGARIAARISLSALASELGEPAADELRRIARHAAANDVLLESHLRQLAGLASGAGIPIAPLKYLALSLGGHTAPGSRNSSDVDILVRNEHANELQRVLQAHGGVIASTADREQHLTPISMPGGAYVEIHHRLFAVSAPGSRRWLTLDDIQTTGLADPLAGWPTGVLVPCPHVLAAHAIAHAFLQHGYQPTGYPLLRALADLADLAHSPERVDTLLAESGAFLHNDLTAEDTRAVARATTMLMQGHDVLAEDSGDDAGARTLVEHIIAGALDERYVSALRICARLGRPSEHGPLARAVRGVRDALFPSRGDLEIIAHTRHLPKSQLARRLILPFDLLLRVLGYIADAAILRLRRILKHQLH